MGDAMCREVFCIVMILFLLSVPIGIEANNSEAQNNFYMINELSLYRHWTNYSKRSTKNSINNITSSDVSSDTYFFPFLHSSVLFGSNFFSFKGGISKDERKLLRVEYSYLWQTSLKGRGGVGAFYQFNKRYCENEIKENGITNMRKYYDVGYIGGVQYLFLSSNDLLERTGFELSFENFKSPELIFFYDKNDNKISAGYDDEVEYYRINFGILFNNYKLFSAGNSPQHLIVHDFAFKLHYGFAETSKELERLVEADTNLEVKSDPTMIGISIKFEPGYMLRSISGDARTSVKLSYLFEFHVFEDDFDKDNVSESELRPGIKHGYFNHGPRFMVSVVF
jgi:hypothetical protein